MAAPRHHRAGPAPHPDLPGRLPIQPRSGPWQRPGLAHATNLDGGFDAWAAAGLPAGRALDEAKLAAASASDCSEPQLKPVPPPAGTQHTSVHIDRSGTVLTPRRPTMQPYRTAATSAELDSALVAEREAGWRTGQLNLPTAAPAMATSARHCGDSSTRLRRAFRGKAPGAVMSAPAASCDHSAEPAGDNRIA